MCGFVCVCVSVFVNVCLCLRVYVRETARPYLCVCARVYERACVRARARCRHNSHKMNENFLQITYYLQVTGILN